METIEFFEKSHPFKVYLVTLFVVFSVLLTISTVKTTVFEDRGGKVMYKNCIESDWSESGENCVAYEPVHLSLTQRMRDHVTNAVTWGTVIGLGMAFNAYAHRKYKKD